MENLQAVLRSILQNKKEQTRMTPTAIMNATTSMTARVTLTYPSGTHDKSSASVGDPVPCSRPTPRREIGDRCDDIRSGAPRGRTNGSSARPSGTVLSRADGRPTATQTRARCCGERLGRCVAEGSSVAVSRTAQSRTDVRPVAPQTRAGAPCLGARAPRQGRRRRSAVATRAKAGRPAGGGGGCPSHAPARVLGGGGGIGVKAGRPAGGGGCPSPNPDPRSPSSAVNG